MPIYLYLPFYLKKLQIPNNQLFKTKIFDKLIFIKENSLQTNNAIQKF